MKRDRAMHQMLSHDDQSNQSIQGCSVEVRDVWNEKYTQSKFNIINLCDPHVVNNIIREFENLSII